jgi:hemerythrin superfamily protein
MQNTEQEFGSGERQPWRQEATALLRADHKQVAELFLEYRRTKGNDYKRKLIDRICRELTVHAQVEEEIFYPAVKEAVDEPEIIAEAGVEHATLKALIGKLGQGQPGDEQFEAIVKVLGEYVTHHVAEEQTEIFPRARASDLDLRELGARLLARKQELMGDGRGASPAPETGSTVTVGESDAAGKGKGRAAMGTTPEPGSAPGSRQ